ncbi:MAG: hypothetical protein Q8K58_11315 [Acidimicrobiales bacterium]|nr:hypothetical protein [Acidimicrobiales bacterium]
MHQPTESAHLRVLPGAGFVSARTDRKQRIHRLEKEPYALDSWLMP